MGQLTARLLRHRCPVNQTELTGMTGIDEEWEAAMTALRDLQATASRLCGEAAQDKATAETNAVARAPGLRAAIEALNETKPVGQHGDKP
jgi:hypothetical protein